MALDPFIASSIISGGANVATSLSGGILGLYQAKKDREFNAEQAQLNRDFLTSERLASQAFDLEMWNLNNDYNDIGSQIARARAAGVNPAALLGGDYKSAQSNPVTTTPQSSSPASSNAGGAVGSALISSASGLVNSFTNGIQSLVQSKATAETIELNKQLLSSNIQSNLANIQKLFADVGLTNATRENIEKATSWMDGLNSSVILERAAHCTQMYNDAYEKIQAIKESQARVGLLDEQTEYQSTLNKYADRQIASETNIAELEQWELQFKKDFASALGIPLGSQEFEFNYALLLDGKFEDYCKNIITPAEQATWKPTDKNFRHSAGGKVKFMGIPLFEGNVNADSPLPYYFSQAGKMVVNPVLEYYKKKNATKKATPWSKFREKYPLAY